MNMNAQMPATTDVTTPVRNRYFYGKLLDVFHFEMEQNYFNTKRWLLNRVVTGYGVICGLQVMLTPDGKSVYVTPGIALDKCGREIIVCQQSEPTPLPQPTAPPPSSTTTAPTNTPAAPAGAAPTTGTQQPPSSVQSPPQQAGGSSSSMSGDCSDTGTYCHLAICYHECPTDPSPTFGGDCDTQSSCSPGAIRERYRLKICDGKQCPPSTSSNLQQMIVGGVLNYGMLATYVSNQKCCMPPVDDCCIPLANIQIPSSTGSSYGAGSIDINIRPLVYTNDMLYDLILAWMNQGQPQTRGTK